MTDAASRDALNNDAVLHIEIPVSRRPASFVAARLSLNGHQGGGRSSNCASLGSKIPGYASHSRILTAKNFTRETGAPGGASGGT